MQDTYKHKGMRKQLIDQLRQKGITDERVLNAFDAIPRHFFLDLVFEQQAYSNVAFQIGAGQTISHPYTVAFQTSILELKKGEKVLEIGTGSGYQASILHLLGAQVVSIEYQQKLFDHTRHFLERLGIQLQLFYGDGTGGVPALAPYDKIIVTAGAPVVPEALIHQLKIGGILVIPVGDRSKQSMVKITKTSATEIQKEEFEGFAFVPLLGKEGWDK